MQSFIVLGIVPGTNIQTTLNFWIAVSALLAVVAFRMRLVIARNRLQTYVLARRIARVINAFEIN